MTELFQQLLEWVALHPYWSWAIIFLVAMAESLAIVGMIIPGVVIMFGIGALIAAGSIAFWPALVWAVAGAVAGDGLSFWIGHHYRGRLTSFWPFSRYPENLSRGIAFFEKYGGKSVAVGRFFGPVRAVIPLVAGMMGMQPWRFVFANVLSALVWAPAYLLPGIVFGASLELASEVALRLVVLILLLAVAVWIIVWLIRRIFLLLHPYTSRMIQGILSWGQRHPRLEGISAALADPSHPEARGLSILATLLILGFSLFTLTTGWTLKANVRSGINYTVLEGLQSLRTPWADHLMVFLSSLADLQTLALLYLSVLFLLVWRSHKHTALYWTAAAGFALLVGPLLKYGFQIPRPDVVSLTSETYAFPSGHTLWATVTYGFLSIMLARTVTPNLRWLAYSLAGLVIAGVAISRLYLGMHWLSDVLGGFTLGMAWISALGIAYSQHTRAEPDVWPLGLTATLSIVLATIAHGVFFHAHKLDSYSIANPVVEMEGAYWWDQGWGDLPQERMDLTRRDEQRLTLQYSGSLDVIESVLATSEWRRAPLLDWNNLLKLLSPSLALQDLPVLPQVHDGAHEALLLEKLLPQGRRLVLRLWPSHTLLLPDGKPLWLGLVGEQHKVELLSLVSFAATSDPGNWVLGQLVQDLAGRVAYRQITIPPLLLIKETREKPGDRIIQSGLDQPLSDNPISGSTDARP